MLNARTVSISIDAHAEDVYRFVREPMNLAAWAKSFCLSVAYKNDEWFVETGDGAARVWFTEDNPYGVLDFYLKLATGEEMNHPLRVLENGDRSEVVATLFRRPEVSEEDFLLDGSLLLDDLRRLKETVEQIEG
ncbi:polyketide cyclase [Halobacillus sp. Marseille-P3879]|uniref:polyketide cyclase n=1 Tax=Halobacillus sp. Marseille-P3879 TaxID=2045014 RepID=UPI000C7AE2DF|nr:polyketide cyclase [Halobacillus sp. Marseille-P3879]